MMPRWTGVGLLMLFTIAVLLMLRTSVKRAQMYEFHDMLVEQTSAYEFWLTPENGGDRFHTTVCSDYLAPEFRTGMILSKVIFIDHGKCWSLDPNQHAGYFIRRDQWGQPVVVKGDHNGRQ